MYADNPILLWLIARADDQAASLPDDDRRRAFWDGELFVLHSILGVCRWLDAEREQWYLTQENLSDYYRRPHNGEPNCTCTFPAPAIMQINPSCPHHGERLGP